jgi:endoglucanase
MPRSPIIVSSVFALLVSCASWDPPGMRAAGKTDLPGADTVIRVNQVGYLAHLPKRATVRTAARSPLAWDLVDSSGKVIASGSTKPFGRDAASGDDVQIVDFSTYGAPGKRLHLRIGKVESDPFDVGPDVYEKLKRDALAYFYQTRSGIAIEMPHAGAPDLVRPAGHLSDKSVPCAPDIGCTYSLDVQGGWYDAGDQGKYVVNGGIAVWTLLNLYERTARLGKSLGDFSDGKLDIPENHNGVSDLLDEARWEIEFMLRMQVPAGNPRAGMVHHKMHDKKWTPLGTAPHEDTVQRYLYAPSTAATLNLAATAAQAARIFREIDPSFAQRCLTAATTAFSAAMSNPVALAPATPVEGGGPYDDRNVEDETYWASAELFVTTGDPAYKKQIERSPHYLALPPILPDTQSAAESAMTWQSTGALGTITLAVVPSKLTEADVARARAAIRRAADTVARVVDGQGYDIAIHHGKGYPWGSNSSVLNNLLLLCLAHDFTGDRRYLDHAARGMDYLLGRNPIGQSYVTGYGARPLKNPHHRFWAHQANPARPSPPPGIVSGGPNSGLQDPYAQSIGLKGCAPARCFTDNIQSYSTNEIAINWNAPLAWVAAFLDEKGNREQGAP